MKKNNIKLKINLDMTNILMMAMKLMMIYD